jgi:hypothetical protein
MTRKLRLAPSITTLVGLVSFPTAFARPVSIDQVISNLREPSPDHRRRRFHFFLARGRARRPTPPSGSGRMAVPSGQRSGPMTAASSEVARPGRDQQR